MYHSFNRPHSTNYGTITKHKLGIRAKNNFRTGFYVNFQFVQNEYNFARNIPNPCVYLNLLRFLAPTKFILRLKTFGHRCNYDSIVTFPQPQSACHGFDDDDRFGLRDFRCLGSSVSFRNLRNIRSNRLVAMWQRL